MFGILIAIIRLKLNLGGKLMKLILLLSLMTIQPVLASDLLNDMKEDIHVQVNNSIKKMHMDISKEIKSSVSKNLSNNGLINPANVKTISYVLASNKGFGRSSFGHSYIRLSQGTELSENDITYEFVADVSDEDLDYTRAIGFGDNYGIRIDKAPYKKARDFHVLEENRDMTTYILDLSTEQKSKIISKLNELILVGTEKKYAFLVNNCADLVTDVLNEGLTKKLTGLSAVTPMLIPDLLEDYDLILDEHIDLRKTLLIAQAVEEKFSKIQFPENSKFTYRLKDLLSSSSLNERLRGYFQLDQLKQEMSVKDVIRVSSMVHNMSKYEHRQLRYYLPEIFTKRENRLKEFISFKTELPGKNFKVKKHKFKVKEEKVFLYVDVTNRKETFRIEYPIEHLQYKNGKIISKQTNQIIFYDLGDELVKERFFHPSSHVFMDVMKEDNKHYLVSYMFTEKDQFREEVKSQFNRDDELAYKNLELSNALETNSVGVCFSHSELSQKLELFGTFLPNESPLTEDENLEIVQKLYNNYLVIIPGYKNAKEFTAAIRIEKLAKVMNDNQNLKYNATESVFSYFSNTSIDGDNIFILQNLIELGLNPIIAFEKSKNFGHSVLVSSVKEKDGKYILNVIDPNMTYQEDIYTLDPATGKVDTTFHGQDKEIHIPFFSVNKFFNLTYLRQNPSIKDVLTKSYKAFGTTNISIKNILR